MGSQNWTWLSNWARMPLILSTYKTLTRELGPNMSLTYWKERQEKLKLRTETPDGARKCQLLLARLSPRFSSLRPSSACKWLAQSWVRPAEFLNRPLVSWCAPIGYSLWNAEKQKEREWFPEGWLGGEGPSHWDQMCPWQVWTLSWLPWKVSTER